MAKKSATSAHTVCTSLCTEFVCVAHLITRKMLISLLDDCKVFIFKKKTIVLT